ncbi:MAG: hypothetical protein WD696_10205 [Bryobacteraceae bacterium]
MPFLRDLVRWRSQPTGLAHPDHPAAKETRLAAEVANQVIKVSDDLTFTQTTTHEAPQLIAAIDRALRVCPTDPDLLFAKAAACRHALRGADADDLLQQAVLIRPDHLDAQMLMKCGKNWTTLFDLPPMSEFDTALHPGICSRSQPTMVYLVRDGLQVGVAIVARSEQFGVPGSLSPQRRAKWIPVWSEAPSYPAVAHYLLIESDSSEAWKAEGFLSTYIPDEVSPREGYWLLRRLRDLSNCFLVLTEGNRVLFSKRHWFPKFTKSALSSIARKIVDNPVTEDVQAFRDAAEWHMEHFDLARVRL